jgi:tetratricopeptide (TPR) repeat protein
LPQQDAATPNGAETVAFETSDAGADGFTVQFDEVAPEAPEPLVEPAHLGTEFVPAEEGSVHEPSEAQSAGATPWDAPAAPAAPVEAPAPPVQEQPAPPVEPVGDDLFADAAAPAPTPEPSPEQQPEPAAMPEADDISDLFEADVEPAAAPRSPGEVADDTAPSEQRLGEAGEAAFEAGDYLAAIDSWSRIYLVDPSDQAVGTRISEAKHRLEDLERRIEHMLFEAQDAKLSGETDKALKLADEILALQPTQLQALELRQTLARPEERAVAPGVHEMPDLDADLFDEKAVASETADEVVLDWEEEERRFFGLPLKAVVMIGVGAVGLVVVLWLASSLFFGSKVPAIDVYEMRAQAEELFRQGKVSEALSLVEGFETTDPADEQVVSRLLAKYQGSLATPTPTPVPIQLTTARNLRKQGYWFHAYAETTAGLRKSPDDLALLEIKEQIEDGEPMASVLHSAIANSNYQSAVGISKDLLERYPGQLDLVEVLERSLFNSALAELRAYNLTGAEAYLRELDERRAGDEVVARILEFIGKYKARPVDMQLKVFIGSIDPRSRRTVEIAETESELESAVATPTPAADTTATEPA